MLTFSVDNLIALGVPLVGVIVAAVFGHLFAGRRDRRNAYRSAASKYRNSILTALAGFYPEPVSWPKDINVLDATLRGVFPDLQCAVAEFRPFVPWVRRSRYDRAWLTYRCATGRPKDIQSYLHYMDIQCSDEPPVNGRMAFRRNVDALLAFAPNK